MFKKFMRLLLCAVFLVSSMGSAVAATPQTFQEKLDVAEEDTYGSVQTGALLDRVGKLEKDYNGVNQGGSMMARVDSIYDSLYSNSSSPSYLAQMNAIEWGLTKQVSQRPVLTRISEMETQIAGKTDTGAFSKRIAKLSSACFGSEILPFQQIVVPANTLIKVALTQNVNAKNLKVGDVVQYKVVSDVYVNGMLVFAKGAPGEGVVTKVKQAQNFGRNAEVVVDFNRTKAIDGTYVTTFVGEEAKQEMTNMAMAAGASLAGMLILGPVGIITGIFVKGKNVEWPVGTELFIQTKTDNNLYALEAPQLAQ